MAGFCFLMFMGYMLVFMVLQLGIAWWFKARLSTGREVPARFLLGSLTITLQSLGLWTMQDKHVFLPSAVIGVAIVAIGLVISMWSQWTLGSSWVGGVAFQRKHKLITTGPYRFVRHPLYSGMYVSALGFGVISLNILFLVGALCFASSLAVRIPAEEQMLRKQYKKRYEAYAARTGALLPRLRER